MAISLIFRALNLDILVDVAFWPWRSLWSVLNEVNEYRKHSSSKRVTTSESSVSIILCERHMYILQSCPSYREVFRWAFLIYSFCLKVYQRYAEVLYSPSYAVIKNPSFSLSCLPWNALIRKLRNWCDSSLTSKNGSLTPNNGYFLSWGVLKLFLFIMC